MFWVVPGHEACNGKMRYGPGVFVEEDECVEVYLLRLGKPRNVRQYHYSHLDLLAPPAGLRTAA